MANGAQVLSGLGFEPVVSRVTLHEGVYQRLSLALMAGRFDPGQTLTIASLSELFGTSHMPVREALRRLAAENALEVASTGTAHVPNVSRAKLDDLSAARIVVEGAAAEMAARRADAAFIGRLQQMADEHMAAARRRDIASLLAHNQEFHFALYRASGSVVLMQLIETLWLQFGPYLRMLTRFIEPRMHLEDAEHYAEHHIAVIEALKAKAAVAVRKHTVLDIQSTQKLLQTLCTDDPKAPARPEAAAPAPAAAPARKTRSAKKAR